MSFALELTFLGVGMVFFVLLLLALLVFFMGRLLSSTEKENGERMQVKEEEVVDQQLVAVITAALASYLERDQRQIKILSLKERPSSAWKNSYREEN